jgi:hypothetical protein
MHPSINEPAKNPQYHIPPPAEPEGSPPEELEREPPEELGREPPEELGREPPDGLLPEKLLLPGGEPLESW